MSPRRVESEFSTDTKVELVLRLLGGETIADVSRQSGRHRKQLSVWRRRFLAGGRAYLESRPDVRRLDELETERSGLVERVEELEAENRMLSRRTEILRERPLEAHSHPYCSEQYARALEEPGATAMYVQEWGTYVLVRGQGRGMRQAVGVRPQASMWPGCDVRGGIEALRAAGVTSVSLITDPMWSPDYASLSEVFDTCRPFKECYLIDKERARIQISKRHRNSANRAKRVSDICESPLRDNLEHWLELYRANVEARRIPQPLTRGYFEQLAELPGLRTVSVAVQGELATITTWVKHRDTLYFHDAASSEVGHATSSSYAAFAHVAAHADDCRYVFLGGSAEFYDDRSDGLARFKRGFSNQSLSCYLCSSILTR